MTYRIWFGSRWRIWTLGETQAFLESGSAWLKAITRIERL